MHCSGFELSRWPCYDPFMADLKTRVQAYIQQHALLPQGATVVAGVSGGADSLCLLHLLRALSLEFGICLHVAHLNHGLRGAEADADAQAVAALAAGWGLPCTVGRADVAALAAVPGVSLEEAARHARYRFLAEVAAGIGATIIAVGHNADDQAETVLMHFLRGSGVAGLRGMLPCTPLADYRLGEDELTAALSRVSPASPLLVRPLLAVPRAEIEAYCAAHSLVPRFDRSNEDTTFFRNRLRHELLPLLTTYNPNIRAILTHTAEALAGDYEVLRQQLTAAWAAISLPASPTEVRFDLTRWRALPLGLQRATVREAVARLRRSLRDIGWEHVETAVQLARRGATGQTATLPAGLALEVSYGELRVAEAGAAWSVDAPQVAGPLALPAEGAVDLGGGWRVTVARGTRALLPPDYASNPDPWAAWLDADVVGPAPYLRPRVPGDRFCPQGMAGHRVRVNEFMINAKTPRAARAGWPLVIGQHGIAWLPGLRLDAAAAVGPETRTVWRVVFERSSPAGG